MNSLVICAPAVPPRHEHSVRANIGDVCVAVAPEGGYVIGAVSMIDVAGAAVRVAIINAIRDVSRVNRWVEPLNHFGPDVHVAFGWVKTMPEADDRLRPHLKVSKS